MSNPLYCYGKEEYSNCGTGFLLIFIVFSYYSFCQVAPLTIHTASKMLTEYLIVSTRIKTLLSVKQKSNTAMMTTTFTMTVPLQTQIY